MPNYAQGGECDWNENLKICVSAGSTWLKNVISHRHSETEQKTWLECWINSFDRRTSLSALGAQCHFENGPYSSIHTENKPTGVGPTDRRHNVNSFGIRLHYPASRFVRKVSVNLQNVPEILLCLPNLRTTYLQLWLYRAIYKHCGLHFVQMTRNIICTSLTIPSKGIWQT